MKKHTKRRAYIEPYHCGACGRLFYIDPRERTGLDLDFGCPYGCDDGGIQCSEFADDAV